MIVQAFFLVLGLAQAPAQIVSGDVPLEVAAKGTSFFAADKATMILNLRCSAESSVEARKLVQERADGLVKELIALGVPQQSISIDEPMARLGFVGNESLEAAMAELPQGNAKPERSSSLVVTLTLTDLSVLPRVRQFLDQKDAVSLESPAFELQDIRAARRAAIADAISKARADADAYAAALGMRVSRLTRVRDLDAEASPFGDNGELFQKFIQQKTATGGKVETDVNVAVEFELAPR